MMVVQWWTELVYNGTIRTQAGYISRFRKFIKCIFNASLHSRRQTLVLYLVHI